jgi:hypothetical protein
LLGLDPLGVVAGEAHVHVRLDGGGFDEIDTQLACSKSRQGRETSQ